MSLGSPVPQVTCGVMAIKDWHYGKLIILWAWGVVVVALAFQFLGTIPSERYVLGTILIGAIAGVPIALSVVTWRWLSGKEEKGG